MATPPLGPEVPLGPEHKRKPTPAQSHVRRSSRKGHGPRLRELLPFVEIVGGFIAITQVICELRGVPARVAAYYSVAAVALLLVVAVGVMYRQKTVVSALGYLNRVPTGVVWIVALGATIALIWVLIWVWVRPKDAWEAWGRDLSHVVRDCQHRGAELSAGEVGQCIATGLSGDLLPPLAESGLPPGTFAQVARDVRAGLIVFQNPELTKRLNDWYGIDDRFVGIGMSQPTDDSAAERVPEFLTPNYNLQDPRIWWWQLDPSKDMDSPISKVLQSHPKGINRLNLFADSDTNVRKRAHAAPNGVPVIRFALLPEGQQPTCLAMPQRRRAFASALDAMVDKTVGDAAAYSGYSFRSFPKKTALYVMVFVPSHKEETVRATWTSILEHSSQWIRDREVCQ